jgi:PAS domain S-box-containing protein
MRSAVTRRLGVLGFALSCAILALVGATSYYRLAELRHATQAVEHTHEVRTELERIQSLVVDAETGQRGFLLTGAVSYLEPLTAALAALPARLEALRRLTVDNPRQQTELAALESLIRRKSVELAATIAARESRGFDIAARIVLSDEGKRLMDQIRTVITTMGMEERRLLTERAGREERAARTAVATTVGGLGLALGLGVAATVLLSRAARAHASAEAARAEAEAVARTTAASEERLRVTVASIGDAVIATDADGRVTLMNAVAEALTGWSADDARGRPLVDVFVILNEITRRPVDNPVDKVLRDGAIVGLANHTVLVRKDGREIPIGDSAAPIRPTGGPLQGVVLVFRDVSAQRQHEQTLFRLASIVESSEDAIITKTFDGLITSWNPGAERMFGYTAAEAVGRPITILFPPNRLAEEAEFLRRLRADERVEHYETERVRKDGAPLHASVSLSPLKDEAGSLIGVSKIVRDITELKRRETQLRSARAEAEAADRAKDEFLALLSHELRTPLTTIVGWIQMLRQARVDPSHQERALDTMARNARALTRMVEDLLDVSRIVAGKMMVDRRPVNLVSVIAETVESFQQEAKAKSVDLVPHTDTSLCVVSADPGRMQQALMNLLGNALRYTPAGGRVDIHLSTHADRATIQVRDTGVGIEPDLLPHVFERFRQGEGRAAGTKGGLGLGLAIVRTIVELHDGTVAAESAGRDQGASFTITLPAISDERGTA